MRIAVTGGKGFQGRALIARLETEGHRIKVFDLPEWDLSGAWPDFDGFDAVFHLAAVVAGNNENHDPEVEPHIMFQNLMIDWNVMSAAVESKVPRFVFASSCSVYPQRSMVGVQNETDQADITDMESGYAVAKLSTEAALFRLRRIGAIRSLCVLRLFNVYGPGDRSSHVIPDLFRKLDEKGEIAIDGDGIEQRCFLYIDDAVEAYAKALHVDYQAPINVGGRGPVTVAYLAKCIAGGKPILRSGKGNGAHSIIPDITIAKHVLGWEPKVSLEEGLQRYAEWIRLVHTAPVQ